MKYLHLEYFRPKHRFFRWLNRWLWLSDAGCAGIVVILILWAFTGVAALTPLLRQYEPRAIRQQVLECVWMLL